MLHIEPGRPRRSCARRGRRRADPQPHIALALAADSQPIPRHLDVERGEPRLDARRRLCGLCGPRKVASMERPPMYARTIERELWMDKAAECPRTWQSNARRADRRRWERDRLAAFSDGVIAIIITIMVLELRCRMAPTGRHSAISFLTF